jgi:hypothetical protein
VVRLVSQGSSWRGDGPVEVVAGELRIGKELNGLQSLLKEWFWTSFISGTLMILSCQCVFFFLANFMWESWTESLRRQREDGVDLGHAPYFFDTTPPQSAGGPFEEDDDHWEAMPSPEDQEGVFTHAEEPDLRQEQPTQTPDEPAA